MCGLHQFGSHVGKDLNDIASLSNCVIISFFIKECKSVYKYSIIALPAQVHMASHFYGASFVSCSAGER